MGGFIGCATAIFFVNTISIKIIYDPAKNTRNIETRSLSFDRVAEFDFEGATFLLDDRRDYGETRQIAIGYLEMRLHVLCFVELPDGIRVISFRKANLREGLKYGKTLTLD
jgi:hypothetical protein